VHCPHGLLAEAAESKDVDAQAENLNPVLPGVAAAVGGAVDDSAAEDRDAVAVGGRTKLAIRLVNFGLLALSVPRGGPGLGVSG
jgi:hypothetical protein